MTVDLLAMVVAGTTVLNFLALGINLFDRGRKPYQDRSKETAEYRQTLERRIQMLEARTLDLEDGLKDVQTDAQKQDRMIEAVLEGVVVLTRHNIDGNHTGQLKEYADKMDKLLIKRG